MNADLLNSARASIANDQILVNVVRLRVRQLSLGHRPLVAVLPGVGVADIALMEIIQNKIRYVPAVEADGVIPLPTAPVVPDVRAKKKAA